MPRCIAGFAAHDNITKELCRFSIVTCHHCHPQDFESILRQCSQAHLSTPASAICRCWRICNRPAIQAACQELSTGQKLTVDSCYCAMKLVEESAMSPTILHALEFLGHQNDFALVQLPPGFATDTLKPARTEVAPATHPAGISHIKPCFYFYGYDNEHRLHIVQYLFAQMIGIQNSDAGRVLLCWRGSHIIQALN